MKEQEIEQRKRELQAIQDEEIAKKKQQLEEKERHRLEVLKNNEEMEKQEKERILQKIAEDENKFDRVLKEREDYLNEK